jgi:hypothetical protein
LLTSATQYILQADQNLVQGLFDRHLHSEWWSAKVVVRSVGKELTSLCQFEFETSARVSQTLRFAYPSRMTEAAT